MTVDGTIISNILDQIYDKSWHNYRRIGKNLTKKHGKKRLSRHKQNGSPTWNGVLAAPTLANIDSDADLELVLTTAHSGLVAYDLPGTAHARILWGSGRGNYQRNGSFLQGTLFSSTKSVQPALPGAGEVLTYTIQLKIPALIYSTW